jgi:predicted acyltransferase
MAEVKFKLPDVRWHSVAEFILDALVAIVAGNLAAKFFLTPNVPITAQITEFLMVLGVVAIAVKYCLSTRIFKGRG